MLLFSYSRGFKTYRFGKRQTENLCCMPGPAFLGMKECWICAEVDTREHHRELMLSSVFRARNSSCPCLLCRNPKLKVWNNYIPCLCGEPHRKVVIKVSPRTKPRMSRHSCAPGSGSRLYCRLREANTSKHPNLQQVLA